MGLFRKKEGARGGAARSRDRKAEGGGGAPRRGLAGLVVSGLLVGALAIGALMAIPRLEQRLGAGASEPPRIVFDWPPSSTPGETWLPATVRDELLAMAYQEVERWPDPFSARALRSAGEAVLRTGWFDRVESVKREAGGAIRISGAWRIPAAVIRRDGIDYLVSAGAEVLPIAYQSGQSGRPAILNARLDPPRAGGRVIHGEVWPGRDVQAGLALLRVIQTRPWRDQIVGVDVAEYLGGRKLVLVTKWNGRAVWGGAPDDSVPGEVAASVKLRRLDILVKEFGQVDARRRLVEVAGPILLVDDTATANAQ